MNTTQQLKKPEWLDGTPEQNERFPFNKELLSLFKEDYKGFMTKFHKLILDKFEKIPNNGVINIHRSKLSTNTQSISHISEDIVQQSLLEIPVLIMMGKEEEAHHIRILAQDIYKLLIKTNNHKGVIAAFRKVKGMKHGLGDHDVHSLQHGESRLSLLKSALETLK